MVQLGMEAVSRDIGRAGLTRRTLLRAGPIAVLPRTASSDQGSPVALGLTPVVLDSDIQLLQAMERELGNSLGTRVSLVKRRTYQEITAMLLAGQVTAAWICGFPYVRHRDQLSILVTPLYRGAPLYQSYFIARTDLPGDGIEAFRGKSHAFSDPDSNSGWLVTNHLLFGMGTTAERFFSRTFFTYGHRNVVRAVGSGLADTGSVDGYVWDVLAEREPELTRQTRIVRRSERFGFPPIACLTSASQGSDVVRLGSALQGLSGTASGRSVLDMLMLDGFAPEPVSLFDPIARMWQDLQG